MSDDQTDRRIRWPRRRWIAAILAVGIVLLIVAPIGVALHSIDQALDAAADRLPDSAERASHDRDGGDLTVLVIGADQSGAGDGLQLLRTSPQGLRTLSIPRDLLLDAWDGGERAATLQHQQGPAAVMRAINFTTDLEVHRVAVIRLKAVRALIDSIGGIEVDNPSALRTREIRGRAWTFDEGPITLDGAQAEAFMRARHNELNVTESDLDRSRRQQLVLTTLLRSIGPIDVLLHPRSLPRNLLSGTGTNLTTRELVTLVRSAGKGVAMRCRFEGEERYVERGTPGLPWQPRRDGVFRVPDEDALMDTVRAFETGRGEQCGREAG